MLLATCQKAYVISEFVFEQFHVSVDKERSQLLINQHLLHYQVDESLYSLFSP